MQSKQVARALCIGASTLLVLVACASNDPANLDGPNTSGPVRPAGDTPTVADSTTSEPAATMRSTIKATTETGATTKVIAKGDHYAVHRVLPDGTVQVKVLTGKDAEMAKAGRQPPALETFMNSRALQSGGGTATTDPAAASATTPMASPEPTASPDSRDPGDPVSGDPGYPVSGDPGDPDSEEPRGPGGPPEEH